MTAVESVFIARQALQIFDGELLSYSNWDVDHLLAGGFEPSDTCVERQTLIFFCDILFEEKRCGQTAKGPCFVFPEDWWESPYFCDILRDLAERPYITV
jgi:hypothetical protein